MQRRPVGYGVHSIAELEEFMQGIELFRFYRGQNSSAFEVPSAKAWFVNSDENERRFCEAVEQTMVMHFPPNYWRFDDELVISWRRITHEQYDYFEIDAQSKEGAITWKERQFDAVRKLDALIRGLNLLPTAVPDFWEHRLFPRLPQAVKG